MIALERDIEHAEIEPILADEFAERGSIERDFLKLRRKLRSLQLRGGKVAVLVQHKSVDYAHGITRKADADSRNLGEKLIGCRRENGERTLSGCPGEKPIVHTEHLQQEFVGQLVGADI